MKPSLTTTLFALLLLCSCGQKNNESAATGPGTQQMQTIITDNYSDQQLFKKDIAGYTVTIIEREALRGSNGFVNYDIDGNYIFIRHLQTNKIDSLMLESSEDMADPTVI